MFSVCVLLYGDHLPLATRCLESIRRHAEWEMVSDVRIGLNAVSVATRAYVQQLAFPVPIRVYSESNDQNVYKYPLMRRMFYDSDRPLSTRVMWFDDDSYLKPEVDAAWWLDLLGMIRNSAVVGSVYRLNAGWRPSQTQGIRAQSWYTGRQIAPRPSFCTGGWWIGDTAFLTEFDYPFKELIHNNGDVLLGELCNQQGRTLRHFNRGVAINADQQGKESKAARRGMSSLWPWQAGYQYDPSFHDFQTRVVVTLPESRSCSSSTSSGSISPPT